MKRKNFLALLVSIVMIFTAFATTGCSRRNEHENEVVVKVWNYGGGVGNAWLDQETLGSAAQRFMEANKDREFANGKKGVYVDVYADKNSPLTTLSTHEYSVFFLEGLEYVGLTKQGVALDITDIVTGTNPYEEGKTIESKMSTDVQDALKVVNDKYYFLPHYQSYDGITYKKTLFDESNLYFAAKESDYKSSDVNSKAYGFIKNANCEKTVGPNGIKGDYDDGLPSSIDELIRLCEYIKSKSKTPFIWFSNSNSAVSYQQKLTNGLWAALEGYDGTMAQFTFDSNNKETTIITGFDGVKNSGKAYQSDAYTTENVKIIPEIIEIIGGNKVVTQESNASKLYQQESRYHALRFCDYLFGDSNNYHPSSVSETLHTKIQKTFLEDEVAMLIEGTYWLNEATDAGTFVNNNNLKDIETAFMPLPVQGTGSVTEGNGKEPVLIDSHSSFAFINANTASKYDEYVLQMAKEFLQFCYTDESLVDFTVDSSVTKGLAYDMGDRYNELTSYAKSVWDIKSKGKTVNPISDNNIFVNNFSTFTMRETQIWISKDVSPAGAPVRAFEKNTYTAKQFFEGLKKDTTWWNSLAR